MKAAFVKVPLSVEIREMDSPADNLAPTDVAVRILYCGLNSIDVQYGQRLAEKETLPLGHEAVGVVHGVGASVSSVEPGQTVAIETHTFHSRDENLKNGEPHHATDLMAFTAKQSYVGEFVRVHASAVHPVRDVNPKRASLTYPLSVALDLVEASDIRLDQQLVVYGTDPVALLSVYLARRRGARQIIVIAKSRNKKGIELAKIFGADEIILSDREHPTGKVMSLTGKRGADRVLIAAPPEVIPQAIGISRFGGIVVYSGIRFGEGGEWPVTFDANKFLFNRLQLRGVYPVPNLRFPLALRLLASAPSFIDEINTHEFPLDKTMDALTMLAEENEAVERVVIKIADA